jgi:hypothetical protein
MNNQEKLIKQLQEQMVKLQNQVNELSGVFYKNNFTSTQVFNKACTFADRLKVPSFDSAPSVAEQNDIMAIAGELYICTSTSPVVWTLVGSQS